MNSHIRQLLRKIAVLRMMKRMFDETRRVANGFGSKRKCYICGATFSYFDKYRQGSKGVSEFLRTLDAVGSDVDNFSCMYCGCNDRERHLFMFFDKLMLWKTMENGNILHFAPEEHLAIKIGESGPLQYVKADLSTRNHDITQIDATAIPFEDDTFDFLIANHILEHIPDYRKALSEFYRILRPGGIAILQTPYSTLLRNNFEDDGIDNDELRLYLYGEKDHVRVFGEHSLLKSLEETGFSLQIRKHEDYFDVRAGYYYGVPVKEKLIMVKKTETTWQAGKRGT